MARKTKTEQSRRLGDAAMGAFERAHSDLILAAELADSHADEHDDYIDELVQASAEARSLAETHRRRASKLGDLLGYNEVSE